MRSFLIMAMFAASFANAAWRDYSEVRELQLDTGGLDALQIDAGAGQLDVRGVSGAEKILVIATIRVEDGEDDARKLIEKDMVLTLERKGDEARLVARFERGMWGSGPNAGIDLKVQVPDSLALRVDDSSGSIDIVEMAAAVKIDDGSGSIDVHGAGTLDIEDGSGSIEAFRINGDVRINDGSGSIDVRDVSGSVYIDDGSGGIKVNGVEADLVIIDDGSGSQTYANVAGNVEGKIKE